MTFQRRPVAEVKADIAAAASLYRDEVRTVFIGDSNSPSIKTADFVVILQALYSAFPRIERVTSYARAKTLLKKPADELQKLREAGLTRLHVGLETGSRELLHTVRKGVTPEEIIDGCRRAMAAGFELSVYVLLGLGGEALSEGHARDTAAVLNRIDPHFIRLRTLQPQPGSQLYDDMQAGLFVKASHVTVFREQRQLLENLMVHSHYLSDHKTNYIAVDGRLPADRPAMLRTIDEHIAALAHDAGLQARCARKDGITNL